MIKVDCVAFRFLFGDHFAEMIGKGDFSIRQTLTDVLINIEVFDPLFVFIDISNSFGFWFEKLLLLFLESFVQILQKKLLFGGKNLGIS